MTRRREDKTRREPRHLPKSQEDRFARWDQLLLAGACALAVATPLIPSEATVSAGAGAPLHVLWLVLLFLWAAVQALRPDRRVIFGWTAAAAAVLIVLHTLSALLVGTQGNARQALNMLWQFISYGAAAFLFRQLLTTALACRALIAVMIAFCVAQSAHGYYEYFIGQPVQRAAFEKDPEAGYRQMGVTTQAQRDQLRWRVESREPLGTFALTNSLAGLLAPWFIVAVGIAISGLAGRTRNAAEGIPYSAGTERGAADRRDAIGAIAVALVIAGCLLLTKSRTAVLACGGGLVLLVLYARQWRWRIHPAHLAVAGGALVALGLVAVAVGGLDAKVLSEAPTSVLYRLEYWQSTARMIADYPLGGCGPGQFQEFFARYKLPQASETPADPHNFLLEIWATAGTPALLALLAMGAAFAWQLARTASGGRQPPEESAGGDKSTRIASGGSRPPLASSSAPLAGSSFASSRVGMYLGALAGMLVAYPLALAIDYPQQVLSLLGDIEVPLIWLVGLPAGGLTLWLLDGWVRRGELSTATLVIALVVLLVNLLAAGAVSFPGVFFNAWLLVVLALANGNAPAWKWSPPRAVALAALVALAIAVLACVRTELSPVLLAPMRIAMGEELFAAGQVKQAEAELLAAAAADPWSPAPWQALARQRQQVWLTTGNDADWRAFLEAVDRYRDLDSRHHSTWTTRGHLFLLSWRKSGRRQDLDEAIAAYRQAAVWYPGRALPHAQLAAALHLVGEQAEADREFDEALRLDRALPHAEQKLARQTLYFPVRQPDGTFQLDPATAEQLIARLRTTSTGSRAPETAAPGNPAPEKSP